MTERDNIETADNVDDTEATLLIEIDDAIGQLLNEHEDEVALAMDFLRTHHELAHDVVLTALVDWRSDQANLALLLGEWGRSESVPALRHAIERGDYPLRYAAATALWMHADPAALETLRELAGSDRDEVAAIAAVMLHNDQI